MESLTDEQKKEYSSYSINQQKDWYIAYLERHYYPDEKKVEEYMKECKELVLNSNKS
jgi:hypothetical protein